MSVDNPDSYRMGLATFIFDDCGLAVPRLFLAPFATLS
jgi:hypothetical protein